MTELQIEHNLCFDFSLTDVSGKALEPVFGPRLDLVQKEGTGVLDDHANNIYIQPCLLLICYPWLH